MKIFLNTDAVCSNPTFLIRSSAIAIAISFPVSFANDFKESTILFENILNCSGVV
jgi:hypothetical protein